MTRAKEGRFDEEEVRELHRGSASTNPNAAQRRAIAANDLCRLLQHDAIGRHAGSQQRVAARLRAAAWREPHCAAQSRFASDVARENDAQFSFALRAATTATRTRMAVASSRLRPRSKLRLLVVAARRRVVCWSAPALRLPAQRAGRGCDSHTANGPGRPRQTS